MRRSGEKRPESVVSGKVKRSCRIGMQTSSNSGCVTFLFLEVGGGNLEDPQQKHHIEARKILIANAMGEILPIQSDRKLDRIQIHESTSYQDISGKMSARQGKTLKRGPKRNLIAQVLCKSAMMGAKIRIILKRIDARRRGLNLERIFLGGAGNVARPSTLPTGGRGDWKPPDPRINPRSPGYRYRSRKSESKAGRKGE